MGFESTRPLSKRKRARNAFRATVAAMALTSGNAEAEEVKLPLSIDHVLHTAEGNDSQANVHTDRAWRSSIKEGSGEKVLGDIAQKDLNDLAGYLSLSNQMRGIHLDAGKETHLYGFDEFCEELSIFCDKFAHRDPGEYVHDFSPELYARIAEVNDAVNASISPQSDLEQYKMDEKWMIPDKAGDCEDYVLLKMIRLIDKGNLDPKYLHILVVGDENNQGHAVLGVDVFYHGVRNTLVLDNKVGGIIVLDAMEQKYQGTMASFIATSPEGKQRVRFFEYKSAKARLSQ